MARDKGATAFESRAKRREQRSLNWEGPNHDAKKKNRAEGKRWGPNVKRGERARIVEISKTGDQKAYKKV